MGVSYNGWRKCWYRWRCYDFQNRKTVISVVLLFKLKFLMNKEMFGFDGRTNFCVFFSSFHLFPSIFNWMPHIYLSMCMENWQTIRLFIVSGSIENDERFCTCWLKWSEYFWTFTCLFHSFYQFELCYVFLWTKNVTMYHAWKWLSFSFHVFNIVLSFNIRSVN